MGEMLLISRTVGSGPNYVNQCQVKVCFGLKFWLVPYDKNRDKGNVSS